MPKNPFGGGKKGYESKNAPQYESGAAQGIANRAGATISQDEKGNPVYDYSKSFNPVTGAAGVQKATEGYDFGALDKAISGFQKPGKYTQTYRGSVMKAPSLDFSGLPSSYGSSAYQSQAGNIRRESQGNLEKTREAVGVRRPGLLAKLASDNDRLTGERLAAADSDINRYVMDRNIDLDTQEQIENANRAMAAQQFNADEQYKGYQSRAERERAQNDEVFRYLQSLAGAGQSKLGAQAGLVESERAYQDAPLQYLLDLFGKGAGLQNQSAQISNQNRASTLGFLGGLV